VRDVLCAPCSDFVSSAAPKDGVGETPDSNRGMLMAPGVPLGVRRKTKVKFVLAFTVQSGGSEVERFEAVQRAQALLSEWQPSKSATIREWVSRCDGNGGFSVIETDNAAELLKDLSTWSSFLEFTVYPVVDITEATGVTAQAIAARQSIS
jgi:hypothetical protein